MPSQHRAQLVQEPQRTANPGQKHERRAVDAEGGEEHRSNERPKRDAQRAPCHVDGHGGVALRRGDHRFGAECAKWMVGTRAQPGHGRQQHQQGKGRGKADGGKHCRRPDEGQADEACAKPIGQPAEEGLGDGGHPAVGQTDQAHGAEGERESVNEERIEDGQQPDVHVEGKMAEH